MRAALYLRVSTEAQAERYSLPAQRRALVDYCEHNGWDYDIYEDAGRSGETIDARPAMQQLLRDALERKFGIALAVEMERFSRSRDAVDLALIKKVFRETGIKFGTPATLFDPTDIEDDFVSGMLGLLASREKQKIVERTRRGRLEAARRGKIVTGAAPFGYRKAGDGRFCVEESEAQTIRLIFGLAVSGLSVRALVRELARRGIASPKGMRFWRVDQIYRVLTNTAYYGVFYHNRLKRTSNRKVEVRRPESEWIPVAVPSIISREVFNQAAARRRVNMQLSPRRQRRFYLLKGLVRCAVCGRAMSGWTPRDRRYYRCGSALLALPEQKCRPALIDAGALEELVWAEVVRLLQQPAVVLEEARRLGESRVTQRDEIRMRLEFVQAALAKIPAKRERVLGLHADGYVAEAETKEQLRATDRERISLEEERRDLEAHLAGIMADETQQARLEDVMTKLADRLGALGEEDRFEVVHAFIRRVAVAPGGAVEIHAYVPVQQTERQTYVMTAWPLLQTQG